MTPPTTSPSAPASCPRCGAAVRAGSDWCTLCFADLRPVPPPRLTVEPRSTVEPRPTLESRPTVEPRPTGVPTAVPLAVAAPPASPVAGSTLTAPTSAPRRDAQLACPRCGEPVLLSVGACESCGAGLFDQLKAGVPTVRVPIFGDVMAMSKGARTGLAFGVAVVIVALLFVLVELLGQL